MPNDSHSDRLSWGDSVFLNLEREGMPLNVASVCIFDGEISFRSFSRSVESKLPLLPRYLKRVIAPPFNIGLPSWEYDPTFDLRNHLNEVHLQKSSETELKNLAGRIFSKVMNRNHPLWDLTLVHGLEGDRTALIARLHHCLADGIAGVGIMNVLLDTSPKAPRLPKRKLSLDVPAPRDPLSALVGGVVDSYSDFVQRTLGGLADVVNMAERTSLGGALPPEELSKLLPEITAFTERLRFNILYRGPQRFAWSDIPLDDVKTIRRKFGASVNDVILALITATIRRYVEFHGDAVKKRLFRMMVPVNLRGNDGSSGWGNRISLVPVTIPLGIRNPKKLLVAVHRRTEFLKRVHAPELVSLAGGLIGIFPSALQAALGPLASRLPVTPFNMVCTNVPGPQYPLYLLGRQMLNWYPYVPVGGEMSLNCAVLSYDSKLYFGFSGDVHAAPDLRRLEKLLQLSFAELREAAEIGPGEKTPRKLKKINGKFHAAKATIRIPIVVPKPADPVQTGQRMSEENNNAAFAPLVS
ncbi:MAG TPA: wax ester/triacylglycerol synthase family O-acyltransferase [Terriglobales bacterium]|nr:wax ester/triacylglycerol synthase family O-acyltransferase [Terriglobales bacterium]